MKHSEPDFTSLRSPAFIYTSLTEVADSKALGSISALLKYFGISSNNQEY